MSAKILIHDQREPYRIVRLAKCLEQYSRSHNSYKIHSLWDHEGCLEVVWKTPPSEEEFDYIIECWEDQDEWHVVQEVLNENK